MIQAPGHPENLARFRNRIRGGRQRGPVSLFLQRDCLQWVDLTCSPRGRRMTALSALLPFARSSDLDFLAACRIAPLAFRRFLDFGLSKSGKRNLLAVRSRAHDAH